MMKARCDKHDLAEAIAAVKGPIDTKSTIPILATVRMKAADGVMELKSTNLGIASAATLPYEGDDFATCAPLYVLEGIAGTQTAEVKLSLTSERLTATAGKARFQGLVLPTEDFPEGFADKAKNQFDIPAADLRRLLRLAISACDNSDSRVYLTGLYITIHEKRLTAVATDGKAMCIAQTAVKDLKSLPENIIIPHPSCNEIIKLCERAEKAEPGVSVGVALTSSAVCVASNKARLWSKLIDGTFPDWRRVYKEPVGDCIEFDCDALDAALARVSMLPSGGGDDVAYGSTVGMFLDEGDLTLGVRTGTAAISDRIGVESFGEWPGFFVTIRVLRVLMNCAKAGKMERLALRGSGEPGEPVYFRHPLTDEFYGVLMPIRRPPTWPVESQ